MNINANRSHLRSIAIIVLILYAIARFFFVGAVFAMYGSNPWIFLIIDCLTAVTYVIGIEHLVIAITSRRRTSFWRLAGWALVAAVSFIAPYGYIYATSSTLPGGLLLGLGLVVALLLANAVAGLRKRLRLRRSK